MLRYLLIFLLVAVGAGHASGQSRLVAVRDEAPKLDLLFERFGSREGLPDNRIRSFYQDHRGFLWVGTMNGLARYDGYQFTLYAKNKAGTGIAGNWTYAVCEDSAGMVWIGTREGLSRFDPRRETFTNYRNRANQKNSLVSNQINTLLVDGRGKLWIGTPEGLTVFNPATRTFRRFPQFPLNTAVGKLIRSAGDYIWVATAAGPVRYNTRTDAYSFHPLTLHPNPYGDRVWSLLEDHGHLYLATANDGLLRLPYNGRTHTYGAFESLNDVAGSSATLRNTEVFDLCKSSTGDLWLGTNQGIARLEGLDVPGGRRLRYYRNNPLNEQSLSNNIVYKIFIDRNDVLWCGTEHGISKLDLHLLPFQLVSFINPQGEDQVRSIAADSQNVWLGTFKSGFYHYNLADGATYNYRFSPGSALLNAHRAMLLARPGELWLGTLAGTVRVPLARPQNFTVRPGPAVFSLLTDSRHNRWVGTNRGLVKLTSEGREVAYPLRRAASGREAGFVRSLYEDQHGRLWVGFENDGLYRLNPETGQFTSAGTDARGEKLLGSTIYAIIESPKDVLWCSSESGLGRLTLNAAGGYLIRNFSTADGLPDQSVNSLQADALGNLWLGSIRGLVRYETAKNQFETFLPNHSFSYSCSSRGNGRELLFGTVNGFIRFDPTAIGRDTRPPTVALTELRLANKPVGIGQVFNRDTILRRALSSTREISLNYLNNGFTLGFTALHFASPQTTTYAYKLDGYDTDWVLTSARNRTATYTNLNPGTYTFRVKVSNGQGRWGTLQQPLVVSVRPAPWKSGWAYTLYALALGVVLVAVGRYLLVQNRQRQQIRFAELEKERLEQLNQLKMEFFTDISHEFRTPLTLIVGPVEALLASGGVAGAVRQQMQMVHRNCRKLLHLIDELMTFQKLEQGMVKLRPERLDLLAFVREIFADFQPLAAAKGLDLQLTTHTDSLMASFDPDKLEKALNNLLSNAVKFTPAGGRVQVSTAPAQLERHPDGPTAGVLLAVADSGKGITAPERQHLFERFFQSETNKEGTGVGLSLTKSLVELHGGHITVESEPNVRTCFTIFLPLEQAGRIEVHSLILAEPTVAREAAVPADQPAPVEPLPAAASLAEDVRPELLVVDDNAEVLDFIALVFGEQYRVTRAENGQQALELVRQREPDLIISDVMMPVMDGFELCRTLKEDVLTSHIPLVLLTAQSTIESRLTGAGLGADEYIPKPFHPELLRVRVAKMIEAHQRLIEKYRAGAEVSPQALAHNPLDEAFLQKVLDVVAANFSNEEFSVEELSSHVNMSRSHLFRKLKALAGQTPLELIYHQRLKHARQLLLERRLNISEITAEVGFKTPSSFSKSFRKQYGKSPTDYLNDALLEQHGSTLSPTASASPTSRG